MEDFKRPTKRVIWNIFFSDAAMKRSSGQCRVRSSCLSRILNLCRSEDRKLTFTGCRTIVTFVPAGTMGKNLEMSSGYNRMQPWLTLLPTPHGLFVPCCRVIDKCHVTDYTFLHDQYFRRQAYKGALHRRQVRKIACEPVKASGAKTGIHRSCDLSR